MDNHNPQIRNPSDGFSEDEGSVPKNREKGAINWDQLILGMKRTTKEFIENVLENIIESIVITNLDGYLVFFNKYSEEMFGFEAREVLNRHIVILGAKTPHVLQHVHKGQTFNGEITLKTKSNRFFPAHVRCVPLRDDQDRTIAMVGVARDLTKEKEKQRIDDEMKRLKAELFQSEKMSLIGTLAGEVAHEINNPLGGLIISVQMLLEDIEKGELDLKMALEELRGIENDAKRCRNITRKLLDFSRRMPEERKNLDLTRVIEDALILVQRQAEIEDISFYKKYAQDLPPVWGNANSLQQVIINLVKNACDAMIQGGRIAISTRVLDTNNEEPVIRISISDTGPGIPHALLEKLFDPFFTTKAGGKGTGLGLAVSKRIVEEQGGRLTCENRKEQSGAVFRILLPISTSHKRVNNLDT
ncbi:MAG: PAS domain-containing protein [Deltaproteobacteria bacterium]|nr:PAS domain-containing protein [Deltaproteobacteria bacterium]